MKKGTTKKIVFLITIDALRKDHISIYGYNKKTTPNIDSLAQRGTIFTNAITNGPESPSGFSAIFTSRLPFLDGGFSPLPQNKKIFPEYLEENGIFTYAIHSNPHLSRFFNYNRGFNIFLDGERYKTKTNITDKTTIKKSLIFHIRKVFNVKKLFNQLSLRIKGFNKIVAELRKKFPFLTKFFLPFTPIAYDAPYIVREIIKFLQNFNNSLFLWCHFMEPHSPFNPPSENIIKLGEKDINEKERFILNEIYHKDYTKINITPEIIKKLKLLYDGEINFLDESLGQLFKFIKYKYKKDCLIIITADHGEAFFEHGYLKHVGCIFDVLLKIPLIIIELGVNDNIKYCNELVQSIDIAPTILDFFDIPIPEKFQGKSLLPLLKGKKLNRDSLVISECYQKNRKIEKNNVDGYKLISIRTNKWKYIYDEEKNKEYLFNIELDSEEKNDLSNEKQELLENFRKIRDIHLEEVFNTGEKKKIIKAISKIKL
ncbi:MAG: sulfatase [Promethearchaeia archaeon]